MDEILEETKNASMTKAAQEEGWGNDDADNIFSDEEGAGWGNDTSDIIFSDEEAPTAEPPHESVVANMDNSMTMEAETGS